MGANNANAPSPKKKGPKQTRNNAQKAEDHEYALTNGNKKNKRTSTKNKNKQFEEKQTVASFNGRIKAT
jgi:hypothetical protein